ncbi:MAG: LD-carboxypeptidase [Sphingobacteriales bacterium]|nr:LD-carboxypeptidase [Sphingobacteriales bacterium]OJW01916.1 MAG: LD-carboxypeptidase [Sphingobacteriales bacterium 44-61]
MIKTPPYLQPGDTIGIVCPAGYMSLEKAAECIRVLREEWGYNVKIGKTLGGASTTYFSGTDEERLTDLQQMLDDDEVKAILCGRGGYGTGRIIEQLDFKKFKKNPKWIIGFSDITVLHSHLYSNYYIASLHAPMAAAFNEAGYINRYVQSLRSALQGTWARYTCEPHPFNRTGEAIGELVGGNLSLIAHLVGSDSDIKTKGRILFLEDIGEYSYNIDRMMYQLKRSGKLKNLAGLIIGGFTDMKDTERPFGKDVYEIIRDIIEEYNYPVCFGFPVSHEKENYALKIGAGYKLKITKSRVLLEE